MTLTYTHWVLQGAVTAARAHQLQQRTGTGEPYIGHPLRVAAAAADAGLSEAAVIAALLHDVVEDTELSMVDLYRLGFSPRTLELVQLLTKDWDDHATAAEKEQKRPRYYAGILRDGEALALKVLDRIDNLTDMVKIADSHTSWARSYLRRTSEEIEPLVIALQGHPRRIPSRELIIFRYHEAVTMVRVRLDAVSAPKQLKQ